MRKVKDFEGKLYHLDADCELAYESVENFINDICDIEIELAINDCEVDGTDYKEDETYKIFKKIKEEQAIEETHLSDLLEAYAYGFIEDCEDF